MSAAPLVLTCGDPAGIGPEIAVKARLALGADLPFAWIGDPRHLPAGTAWQAVDAPLGALTVAADVLQVSALAALADLFAVVVDRADDIAD